ncbi:hypothetical protein C6A85_000000114760 [Mycobacterium sp. ITM-2017-0098]|nr:hypothetical protein C6A85_000000114760 [Mycobacterium sp. ITM-2017-0098]
MFVLWNVVSEAVAEMGERLAVLAKACDEWIPPPDLDWGHHPLAGDGQHRVNGYHHPERYLLPEDDGGP